MSGLRRLFNGGAGDSVAQELPLIGAGVGYCLGLVVRVLIVIHPKRLESRALLRCARRVLIYFRVVASRRRRFGEGVELHSSLFIALVVVVRIVA
jgi:hypothetical protein